MRKKLSILFLFVSVLTLVPVVSVSAEKPHLIGIMDLTLKFEELPAPYPSEWVVTWQGHIDFGPGKVYGMRFILIGTGIPREDPTGKAGHFGEIWEIFDDNPNNLILWGFDKGVTNQKKGLTWPYRMNGHVEDAALDWEAYLGRNVHMSGDIVWVGAPFTPGSTAPGEFRIN